MARIFKHYLVLEGGDVEGTDDDDILRAALKDGATLVITPSEQFARYDDATETIKPAEPGDWLDDEEDDE